MAGKKHTFAYGWGLQVLVGLMFFFYAGIGIDGQNVTVPAFVALNGWDYGDIITLSGPAGIIGLLGIVFFSWLVTKRGSKFVIVLTLIGSGVVCLFFGRATSVPMYALGIFLIFFFTNGYGNVATGALTASWFPRRRGYALGWSSMGLPVATAIYVPVLAFLVHSFSLATALTIVGVVVILLGISAIFWVKNTPEEMGLAPDGMDAGIEELRRAQKEMREHVSQWTPRRLLSNKVVWLQSVSYGLLFMTTIALVSQMVPRLMGLGYSQDFGLGMLSLAAVVGIVGSVVWGIIDMKIGTRKTTMVYALWYAVAVVVLLLTDKSLPGTVIGICMAGVGIGGIGNLQPSMLAQTFGRFDYASASRVVNTLVGLIRIMAFPILGLAIKFTGSIDNAYIIFVVANIVALILMYVMDEKIIGRAG